MKKVMLIGLCLLSLCGCTYTPVKQADREKQSTQVQPELESKRQSALQAFGHKYGIDFVENTRLLDELNQQYLYSVEIEDKLIRQPILFTGCIKDITHNYQSEPIKFTILAGTCGPSLLPGNNFYYELKTSAAVIQDVMSLPRDKGTPDEPSYMFVAKIDSVPGVINKKGIRRLIEVKGECLDVQPYPELAENKSTQ